MLLAPVPVLFYGLLSQKLAPAEKNSTDTSAVSATFCISVLNMNIDAITSLAASRQNSNALISKFFKVRGGGKGGKGDLYPNCFSELESSNKTKIRPPLKIDNYAQLSQINPIFKSILSSAQFTNQSVE